MKKKFWIVAGEQVGLRGATVKIGTDIIKLGEGNLTWSEKRNIEFKLDTGKLDDVRRGDDVPMEVSLQFTWEYSTYANIEQLFKGAAAVGSANSGDSYCNPYHIDLVVELESECAATGGMKVITFPDFFWETWDPNLQEGQVSVAGKCNAERPVYS